VLWMVRRMIAVFCIFFFETAPSIQIGILLTMSVLWAGYIISSKPFENPKNNWLDFKNELFYYVALDLSFTFTVINENDEASIVIG
jgi:hypothetical protein